MSAYRSILVHLDATPRALARLQIAAQLAERHDGVATVLYAVSAADLQYPFGAVAGAEARFTPALAQFDEQRRARAQGLFERARADAPHRLKWSELSREEGIGAFGRRALCADLLVLGQREASATSPPDVPADFVESVLIDSGRPALVVPYIGARTPPGRTVLVAWKPTREAARAVTAALPLLQGAERVHLALWHDPDSAHEGAAVPIEAYLHCHGVAVTVHEGGPATREIGEHVLSLGADLGADLLVMGCYGHTRAREWVLGGATRTVLKSMTMPVLMAH